MISTIIPVYHNEETLKKNIRQLSLIDNISEIVLVFDGYKPLIDYSHCFKCKQICNYPDIPWGNSRARNIGAINAKNDYLLFIDVDHTLKHTRFLPSENHVYKFKRVLQKTEWHCNTLLMHRNIFFDVGGYDERFCGNYGYEDRHIEFKLRKAGYQFINLSDEVTVLDNGGVNIERDKNKNKVLFEKLKNEIRTH